MRPVEKIFELLESISGKYSTLTDATYFVPEITRPQARILLLLDTRGALSVSEIARVLNMADSNVSNICSRLEKAGYVVRKREQDDQRVVTIELTPLAEPKIKASREKIRTFHQKTKGIVSRDDMEIMVAGLEKLDSFLEMFIENQM